MARVNKGTAGIPSHQANLGGVTHQDCVRQNFGPNIQVFATPRLQMK